MYLERQFTELEKKFYEGINSIISSLTTSIYDLEYVAGSKTLRLYIIDSQTNTATLDNCVEVDRSLSDWFEQEEWIPEDIILEVSSPGVYRELHTKEHFESAIGESIKLQFISKITKDNLETDDKRLLNQKKVIGTLKGVTPEELTVLFFDQEYVVNFNLLKKVNIEYNQ